MPQFELDAVGVGAVSGLVRGRTAEDAIRRAAGVPDHEPVEVAEAEEADGWQSVRIGGAEAGRLRAHQRMRFRRD